MICLKMGLSDFLPNFVLIRKVLDATLRFWSPAKTTLFELFFFCSDIYDRVYYMG